MTEPKELEEELIRCSSCKSMKFKSFFIIKETNRRVLKTCIKCREKYKCNIENCTCICSSKGNLQQHIKQIHTKLKDFECTYEDCNFKSSLNSTLQRHIKQVHTKIKDFICNIEGCNYKFSENHTLQRHINTVHNHIKDFECNIEGCNFKFSLNSHLQNHIKQVHDKIKDFICNNCTYKCSFKGTLQQHIKTCTGNRNISSGEFEVINNLERLGLIEDIDYIHDSTFIELTNYCDRNLRFDFRLINHKIIIEFDGEQHFKPQAFGGISKEQALKVFKELQESDRIKDEFCKKFDYKMIRISYKQFPNILSILHGELLDIVELD